MWEFINLFIEKDSRRIGNILVAICLIVFTVLFIDKFTAYPSLSFTKEKYELVKSMAELERDTSLTIQQRKHIKDELTQVISRRSLQQIFDIGTIAERNLNCLQKISNIIPQSTGEGFLYGVWAIAKYIVSWLVYIFCSSIMWLMVSIFAIAFAKEAGDHTAKSFIVIFPLGFLLAYGVLLIINPEKHILTDAWISQGILYIALLIFSQVSTAMIPPKKKRPQSSEPTPPPPQSTTTPASTSSSTGK